MEPIAQREVILVNRNTNREQRITFAIMAPYAIDNGENYMCMAKITGDIQESFRVGGVDSLQALMLAIQCLDMHYETMKKHRYDFFWPDRTHPMTSFDLIREDMKRFYDM